MLWAIGLQAPGRVSSQPHSPRVAGYCHMSSLRDQWTEARRFKEVAQGHRISILVCPMPEPRSLQGARLPLYISRPNTRTSAPLCDWDTERQHRCHWLEA